MKNPKLVLPLLAVLIVAAAVAYADTPVTANQGKPGPTDRPWPVTVVTGGTGGGSGGGLPVVIISDGGYLGTTAPVACRSTALDGGVLHQTMQMGNFAIQVPLNPSVGRVYVNVCSSVQNVSSSTVIKCRMDGTAPVFTAGTPGISLLYGDCVLSTAPTTANTVRCISNIDAGNYVDTYECIPQ